MAKSKKVNRLALDENGTMLVPPPKTVPNKEHLQRLSYLYQLATFNTIMNTQDSENSLARLYAKNLDLIQKKTKCSLGPGLKRTLCKTCHRVLIPTKTVRPRMVNKSKKNSKSNDVLLMQCVCGAAKRFPVGRDAGYKTYSERDGNTLLLDA